MPHCWPQKQQCVLTSFSASRAESCQPPGGVKLRWGPKCAANASGVSGSLATGFLPNSHLRDGERFAFAGGAQLLPTASGERGRVVIEAELREDGAQIVDMHAGGEALAAAHADSAGV